MPGGPISGRAFAARIAYYIQLYGQSCDVFALQPPVITGGQPGSVTYVKALQPVTVMIQEGQAAADAAYSVGVLGQQVALAFLKAEDAGLLRERDILKDGTGRFWTVNAMPGQQALASVAAPAPGPTTTLAAKYLLVKLPRPPSGVS